MKGVIYARYSSDNQREESIEGQLRECKEYAERNDITILGTYIDRALSAKTDNRPEFQHMIKESAKGLFDVVLVWKLDRFARNRYDSARYKNLLKKNGVKVISARENISEGSEGIILEAMLEGYAEYYSAELSEKVIRGLTDNALKCKYNGGTVPMGYYIDEQQYYQIDPKTAPVVLEMFTKYSEGATMQELVNLLNSRGMRSIRGGKITLNIMNHLLKNRRYMGEYSYRDVVKENGIPAIVPKELFERVQERLAKNKKAPARHKAEDDYLLTTKLYCGKCGSFMVGESGTSHTMKVHRYYRCVNTKKKKLCDKKAVKKDWIEDLVVNYTMKAIMNDEVMERLIDTLMELQKKESTDLPLLKKQLAETEKGINNMLNAIQAGIFTPSTKQRLDELEETKSQLEVSILQEEMHKPLLTREQIAFFIYRFRKFDVTKREQRQRLIDSFVNAVYLYEDKIILTFNYKDGSKTITLAEVEGSDLSVLGAPEIPETEVSPMKRIASIQDISCLGRCSLTVALPVISALGVECAIVPTAVLSAHTAFPGFVSRDLSDQLTAIAAHWRSQHVHFDALYTGYIASAAQVRQVLDFFDAVRSPDTMIFVDPAMADHGKLYTGFGPDFPSVMAQVVAQADVAIPNLTEACLLTGTPYREEMDEPFVRELLRGVAALGAKRVVLTGVSFTPDKLGAMGYDSCTDTYFTCLDRRQRGSFHGTGDIFAATVVGGMMRGLSLEEAASLAVRFTLACIDVTARDPQADWYGVEFEKALPLLCDTARTFPEN